MGSNTINMKMKLKLLIGLMLFGFGASAQVGVAAADTSLRATVNGQVRIWKNFEYYKTAFGLYYNKVQSDARFALISGSGNYIQNQNSSAQTANAWISGLFQSTNARFGSASSYTALNQFGLTAPALSGFSMNFATNNVNYLSTAHNFGDQSNSVTFLHLGDGSSSAISFMPYLNVTGSTTNPNSVVTVKDLPTLVPTPTLQSVTTAGDSTNKRIVTSGIIKSNQQFIGDALQTTFAKTSVYYGDSETLGAVGPTSPYFRWSSIVSRATGYAELNRGIGGTTLVAQTPTDSSGFNRRLTTPNYDATKGLQYVMYGVNDAFLNVTVADFTTALDGYISAQIAKSWTGNRLVLVSPFPASGHSPAQIILLQGYAAAMASKASQYGIKFVDVTTAVLNYPASYKTSGVFIIADGTHLNNNANYFVAKLVQGVISNSNNLSQQVVNNGFEYNNRSVTIDQKSDSTLLNMNDGNSRPVFAFENYYTKQARLSIGASKLNYVDQNKLFIGQDLNESSLARAVIDMGSSVTSAFNDPANYKFIIYKGSTPTDVYGITVAAGGRGGMEFKSGTGGIQNFSFHGQIFSDATVNALTNIKVRDSIIFGISGQDANARNAMLLYNNGGRSKKSGIGMMGGGSADLAIFSNGSDGSPNGLMMGVGYDALTLSKVNAALWIRKNNKITLLKELNAKSQILVSPDSIGLDANARNILITYQNGTPSGTNNKTGIGQGGGAAAPLVLFGQNSVGTIANSGVLITAGGTDGTNTTPANAGLWVKGIDNTVQVNTRLLVKNKADGLTTDSILVAGTGGELRKIPNVYVSGTNLADTTASLYRTKANSPTLAQLQTRFNLKQNILSGTGFIKASGTTISYDNNTYAPLNANNIFTGSNVFQNPINVLNNVVVSGNGVNGAGAGGYVWSNDGLPISSSSRTFKVIGDANGSINFWTGSGSGSVLTETNRLTISNVNGTANYNADVSASYTDRSLIDLGNVKKYVHSETGYSIVLTASGNGSSTTITIPHGLTGIDTDSFVLLTANSEPASNFKYARVDATNIYIYYSVAPATGTQNLYYSALIKYIQR